MNIGFSGDLNWAEAFTIVGIVFIFFYKRPLIVITNNETNIKGHSVTTEELAKDNSYSHHITPRKP